MKKIKVVFSIENDYQFMEIFELRVIPKIGETVKFIRYGDKRIFTVVRIEHDLDLDTNSYYITVYIKELV